MRAVTRSVIRKNSSAQWQSQNPILLEAEFGYDSDLRVVKIGDGHTHWNNLPIITGGTDGGTGTNNVVDNGDGTYTITGAGVVDNGDGTYTITGSDVVDNGDGTYTIT